MNMSMTTRTTLAVLAFAGAPAFAQAPASDKPGDYTHAIALTVSGKNAVVQVRLPQGVYLNARSAALDDLRVFDANGKPLPYALVQPAAQSQSSKRQYPMKIFPVGIAPGDKRDVRNDMEVKTSADGSMISVTTRHLVTDQSIQHGALVLDAGPLPGAEGKAIDTLVFTLPEGLTNYEAQVQLDVSDDQRRWETVGYASLSWLANSNRDTLTNNRMEFDPRAFRYARLSWRQGAPIQFAAIVAETQVSSETAPAQDSVTLKPHPGSFVNDLVYNAAAAIPVRRMNLQFAEQNVVMPALLGHYLDQLGPKPQVLFQPRLHATFFKISQGGRQRSSGEIGLNEVHANAWVVRPLEPNVAKPDMKLSWTPASMVFMAGGAAPYTLRFGRPDARPGRREVSQVAPGFTAAELQGLEQALPGTMVVNAVQAGAGAAAPSQSSGRGRLAALWGVLLLGVGVLGFMVWRLSTQMKSGEE